ncbi:hypothetical protein CCP4SC76_1630006 [Gammaproteobacteria bacterium]
MGGFLAHIKRLNQWDPEGFHPWWVDDERVGFLRSVLAERLLAFSEVFVSRRAGLTLAPDLVGFEDRTRAVHRVALSLVQDGLVEAPIGEWYSVTARDRGKARLALDRAFAPAFGIRALGQHLNGFVRRPEGLHLWVARRAAHRLHFPNRLDNLVAGGLPHGANFSDNLAKEGWEEASIPPELMQSARPVGVITYCRETPAGLKPDTMYCYDLALPEDFTPSCNDGEVAAFHLWPATVPMGSTAAGWCVIATSNSVSSCHAPVSNSFTAPGPSNSPRPDPGTCCSFAGLAVRRSVMWGSTMATEVLCMRPQNTSR